MKIIQAKTLFQKLKGLMFHKQFDYIVKYKTNRTHTFLMKTNIDVTLPAKNNKILYIYRNLIPNKIILPKKKVKYTYEMPVNYINNLKLGETFKEKN